MKLSYAFFMAVLISCININCMETEKGFNKALLEKVNENFECLKYFVLQHNISSILDELQELKKTGHNLEEYEKQEIQNEVITLFLKLLTLPADLVRKLKKEYYLSSNIERTLSSNDPSPRIEENDWPVIDKTAIIIPNDLPERQLSSETEELSDASPNYKQGTFRFLTRIIQMFQIFKESIQKAQGDMRLYCQEGKKEAFLKIYQANKDWIDLNDRNGVNKALVHYGVDLGDESILEMLLKDGSDPEIRNMHGDTPLLQAVKQGKIEIVRCLLNFGANPLIRDKGGIWQKSDGSRIKLSRVGTEESLNPLVAAMHKRKGAKHEIELLLTEHIDNLPSDYKFRFLAQAGELSELKNLLKKIIKNSSKETVDLFINSVDPTSEKSALHYAAGHQQGSMILYLIEIGVNPDLQDAEGNTPLHYAVIAQYKDGVILLLFGKCDGLTSDFKFHYKGAEIKKKNKQGYTPKEIAKFLKNTAILAAIEDKKMAIRSNKLLRSDKLLAEIRGDFGDPTILKSTSNSTTDDDILFNLEIDDHEIKNKALKKPKNKKSRRKSLGVGTLRKVISRKERHKNI